MDNHYHLLIETPHGELHKVMHGINASYSNWFKTKYNLTGGIFQGRYKAHLIEDETYLLAVSAYIHLNPVRKGLVEHPEEYKWSSMKYYVTAKKPPEWLEVRKVLSLFTKSPRRSYRRYVMEQMGREKRVMEKIRCGFIIGTQEFAKRVLKGLEKEELREYSERRKVEKITGPQEVIKVIVKVFKLREEGEIFEKRKHNTPRKTAMYLMKKKTALTLKEIGKIFGVDYVGVSMSVKRFEKELEHSRELKTLVEKAEKLLG